uniref:Putative secreted peptide n=1 Tax=Anopheles braziliensis TaxID=58242 RepID=A0A2M3ZWN5_9DIPT
MQHSVVMVLILFSMTMKTKLLLITLVYTLVPPCSSNVLECGSVREVRIRRVFPLSRWINCRSLFLENAFVSGSSVG